MIFKIFLILIYYVKKNILKIIITTILKISKCNNIFFVLFFSYRSPESNFDQTLLFSTFEARESHLKTLLCRWRSAALVLFFFSTATLVADPWVSHYLFSHLFLKKKYNILFFLIWTTRINLCSYLRVLIWIYVWKKFSCFSKLILSFYIKKHFFRKKKVIIKRT